MILPWLLLVPFAGGLLCWQLERFGIRLVRWVAVATIFIVLILAVELWLTGDTAGRWTEQFSVPWIPRLGIRFALSLDGLSLLLIGLTALLGLTAVACSWREITRHIGFFHLNLMWTLGGVIGVFLATDLFLFFLFWEVMLVPMFFLIALWGHNIPGGNGRIYAATKFFIFTQASGLVMLVAILALVFVHNQATGFFTFSYSALLHTPMSARTEFWIMLGFFVAFAVKLPVVPLHTWLPDAHSQAPTAGSVVLAGVLLKTAAYGLLRFLTERHQTFGGLHLDQPYGLHPSGRLCRHAGRIAGCDHPNVGAWDFLGRPVHPLRPTVRTPAYPRPSQDGGTVGAFLALAADRPVLRCRFARSAGSWQFPRRILDSARYLQDVSERDRGRCLRPNSVRGVFT